MTDPGQVDAVQDHLELSGGQLQGGFVRGGFGELVTPGLQTLAPEAESVSAPVEDLETLGLLVSEYVQMTRKGIPLETIAHQGMQTIEPQTYVDGSRTIPGLTAGERLSTRHLPKDATRERTKSRSYVRHADDGAGG